MPSPSAYLPSPSAYLPSPSAIYRRHLLFTVAICLFTVAICYLPSPSARVGIVNYDLGRKEGNNHFKACLFAFLFGSLFVFSFVFSRNPDTLVQVWYLMTHYAHILCIIIL